MKPKTKHYRPSASYLAKDPVKRATQLSNLQTGRGKRSRKRKPTEPVKKMFTPGRLAVMDIITFAVEVLHISFVERPAQEVVLRAMYGLPMDEAQVEIYKSITGKSEEVFEPGIEKDGGVWAVGARGGKSLMVSIVALFECICQADHWRKFLNPGEIGYCVLISTRQEQSQVIIQANILRLLEQSEISGYYLEEDKMTEICLASDIKIVSSPCRGKQKQIFL